MRDPGHNPHTAQAELAALMAWHDAGLRRLAYRLLQSRDDMDDVLQDVYLKAYHAISGFRGEADAGTWLYRVTYNACIDQLRRRAARPSVPLDLVPEPGIQGRTHDDPGERVPERRQLADALALLPPDQRAAVLLVDAEGYTYAEAAVILGVREGTVASRLHHARAALRRALKDDDRTSR